MLANPIHHKQPYPYFTVEQAFAPADRARLEGLFELELSWLEHGGSFYEVRNCDVTDRVQPALLTKLADRMRALTGLPLAARVAVTAQTMAPGQQIGVHSDRPLVGFETVRLVVQCNRDWKPGDGGILQVHDDEAGTRIRATQAPRLNNAFGFIMHPGSYHSVTETAKPRRTLVFNFWHIGNSSALRDEVKALFADMQFASLPRALDPICIQAEQSLPEEQTYRALVVAIALQRWGLSEQVILDGYRAATRPPAPPRTDSDGGVAIALAQWAAHIHLEHFDLEQWQALALVVTAMRTVPLPRLVAFRHLAFPGP